MSTDHSENTGGEPLKKHVSKGKFNPTIILNVKAGDSEIHTTTTESKTEDGQQAEINVIVAQHENLGETETNRIAKDANKIANRSVIVNAGLLIGTITLAVVATCQYKSADDAAQTAKNTLSEVKRFDSTTLSNQAISDKKRDSLDSVKYLRDDSLFHLQKTSDSAQIAYFKQSQKDFEIENNPYLQVMNISNLQISDSETTKFDYEFRNSGKSPVKIYSFWIALKLAYKDDTSEFLKDPFKDYKNPVNTTNYMTQGQVDSQKFVGQTPNIPGTNYLFYSNQLFAYFIGRVKYVNKVTNKNEKWDFVIHIAKIKSNNGTSAIKYLVDDKKVIK